ncbi:MAG: lipoprotein-releasing ABC transporter permease subunit [Gammaproteobacteria bacterium]|nr:lipoprotein-releasing ABC transporter permease subunit [Gammaproteobacteria bacterium]MDH5239443.1 lipoprotein-releasing ABC transporter permease subunit [Gammaproteobacteria bacterium]MDH5260420.1 lipoprotein-releasing ABC transporter permease subunit [Gammaproteobacteria bacterium]MDH5621425.1 lipoprotein-releasing ABC transporter permease subunit [Gammaproteobacteria bacterium]
MLNPVELFIGLRYLRAKRRTRFVSFITLISLLGISLGVAALIVILSVMNGFEGELRSRLLSMSAHGSVSAADGTVEDWATLVGQVGSEPGVAAAAPFIQMEGMIQSGRDLVGVVVHGVEPAYEKALSGDMINMVEGSLDVLRPGERSIVLGRMLAYDLGARIGDAVVLLVPKPVGDGTLQPVLQRFITRGIFEAGLQDHDAVLALVNINDVADILDLGTAVNSVRFRANDVMAAPAIAASLRAALGEDYRSSDWTIENGSYFRAIRLEKMMMSLILSLIIGVAAFNIVASLVMVVTDKTNDIAVLRTLGMRPAGVVKVFFVQGAVIGWAGVALGVLLGVLVAIDVPTIVPALEQFFGFQIMPGDVYYVTEIPSELEVRDVLVISVAAFILTSLATLYPARRAALVNPAAALRYE